MTIKSRFVRLYPMFNSTGWDYVTINHDRGSLCYLDLGTYVGYGYVCKLPTCLSLWKFSMILDRHEVSKYPYTFTIVQDPTCVLEVKWRVRVTWERVLDMSYENWTVWWLVKWSWNILHKYAGYRCIIIPFQCYYVLRFDGKFTYLQCLYRGIRNKCWNFIKTLATFG